MSNRWGNCGNSDKLCFLASKITADGDCSHKIKRHLLFGRKVMTNLDSILKSRDITLPTMVHLVKAMVFPEVMYGWELDYKKAEHWSIDGFELWCWRRLLRVPWTARRSNQSILKEISPGCSLEGLMLKLKLQYSCLENSMDRGQSVGLQRVGHNEAINTHTSLQQDEHNPILVNSCLRSCPKQQC